MTAAAGAEGEGGQAGETSTRHGEPDAERERSERVSQSMFAPRHSGTPNRAVDPIDLCGTPVQGQVPARVIHVGQHDDPRALEARRQLDEVRGIAGDSDLLRAGRGTPVEVGTEFRATFAFDP